MKAEDPDLLSKMEVFVDATKALGCMFAKAVEAFMKYFDVDREYAEEFVRNHWG